jgi:hypothetical protein
MVFNATFKNISVISWRSVVLVNEFDQNVDIHSQPTSHHIIFETEKTLSKVWKVIHRPLNMSTASTTRSVV